MEVAKLHDEVQQVKSTIKEVQPTAAAMISQNEVSEAQSTLLKPVITYSLPHYIYNCYITWLAGFTMHQLKHFNCSTITMCIIIIKLLGQISTFIEGLFLHSYIFNSGLQSYLVFALVPFIRKGLERLETVARVLLRPFQSV